MNPSDFDPTDVVGRLTDGAKNARCIATGKRVFTDVKGTAVGFAPLKCGFCMQFPAKRGEYRADAKPYLDKKHGLPILLNESHIQLVDRRLFEPGLVLRFHAWLTVGLVRLPVVREHRVYAG